MQWRVPVAGLVRVLGRPDAGCPTSRTRCRSAGRPRQIARGCHAPRPALRTTASSSSAQCRSPVETSSRSRESASSWVEHSSYPVLVALSGSPARSTRRRSVRAPASGSSPIRDRYTSSPERGRGPDGSTSAATTRARRCSHDSPYVTAGPASDQARRARDACPVSQPFGVIPRGRSHGPVSGAVSGPRQATSTWTWSRCRLTGLSGSGPLNRYSRQPWTDRRAVQIRSR